jgi:hypothetical protein
MTEGGPWETEAPFSLPFPSIVRIQMVAQNNPYVKDVILFLAAIVVSMSGFWMMTGRDLITRDEARLLVQQQTIAMQTKLELYHEALLGQEDRISRQEEKLQTVLERNTEAINALKVQIATLSQSLEILTGRNP